MSDDLRHREIPFNYTSADDRQAVTWLLGEENWNRIDELRSRRVTGRSARLLQRIFGEVLVHRRNPFLYQELVDDEARRRKLFRTMEADLRVVEASAGTDRTALEVVASTRALIDSFRKEVLAVPPERRRILAELGPVVGRENVLFDPFTLVSHATDATDWRLHLPAAVVMPTDEVQVAPLLAAIERLGCGAVPRGAGTGLTGGAIPLRPNCVIVNTEKLNRIRGIEDRTFRLPDGRSGTAPVLSLEAGVITEHAMEHAEDRGLVFAVDPTSAWASTIGGNIAENAGGKTAVLWGTCVDNLLGFDIAMPGGKRLRVRRLDHPLRKILPEDSVSWEVRDPDGTDRRTVTLAGTELRRKGLWKDITNKALKGLPGLQKEGTDGVITSAEFLLYRRYPSKATLCLEFFGPDLDEASRVILELSRAFPIGEEEVLQALEHFDGEYVRAIGYKTKAPRADAPKAVLLVDLVGHSPEETERGVARVRQVLAPHANTALFVARDDEEARLFWADRKKLGAIAAHTNAFKLNEDVVLPLEALAEFARFCEGLNAEEERHSLRAYVERARAFLQAASAGEESPWLAAKIESAAALCGSALADLDGGTARSLSAIRALHEDLLHLVRGYDKLTGGLETIRAEARRRRVVIATHMHAGDGNVHVNIPILSNDREMIRRAELVVDRVMEKVAAIGGVCSGEHGIGVTKLKYLDPERLRELEAYRRGVDPKGVMNPGKLSDLKASGQVFTPSFNLLELEARILRYGKMEELALRIAHCVRCGKCKRDCCVFHPPRGLFYHPRNKNLAIGALIEALLYDVQRDRSAGFGMLRSLEDVADHCTICHKCLKPCPVDIDTGEVSVLERGILVAHGYKHTAMATKATLGYLESRSPAYNAAFRAGVLRFGGWVQRALSKAAGPARDRAAASSSYAVQMLGSPVPAADRRTLRASLPRCEAHQALVFEPEGEAKGTVFYFPGCGSERLFSRISRAALHVLLETGTRVVLPPPFLCCGFPHKANARDGAHGRIVLRDTIVLSQIREMFAYLRFDAVGVTCGTCREALGLMEAGEIFDAPVTDVARFAIDRGLTLVGGGEGLYHAPCHDSLDGRGRSLLEHAAGLRLRAVPHCCSEAGTLALSRPDISNAMLHRKAGALREGLAGRAPGQTLLTNCPSCLQGLGRNASLGFVPRHVVEELARRHSGQRWEEAFRAQASRAVPVHF
jgi:FAD/FMN-containing dehydrogenase/Fe-S oxidoreductase